jgi:penicillin amidase
MRSARWALVLLSILLLGVQPCGRKDRDTVAIPGLLESVRVVVDREGVPHIYAGNDLDLARVAGYVHARDRFFQMDLTRREVSGDRAEVLGSAFIGSDIQNRTIGLRRAAERSLAALTPREHEVLQSYADGVNAYILNHPLPSEYASLELTQVRPWDVVDTLVIGKAIAASLSLDIDVGLDDMLEEYVDAGNAGGYDGEALLFQDVLRSAPMDPASTVPDATGDMPFDVAARKPIDPKFLARVAPLSRGYAREVADNRLLAMTLPLARREQQIGSNEWGVSASSSASGNPIIANDPHLSLNMPSTFYEWHLHVSDDPEAGPMNVSGVGFPGAPGVILGQNDHITWGATTNPMDVSDVFLDRGFVNASECGGAFVCIESDGQFHPAELSFAIYLTNQIGDGIQDNIVPADVSLLDSVIVTVPFRGHGPVIFIENPGVFPGGGETDVLVLQYTGFHATREVGTFLTWNRARNLDEFVVGLQSFDVGSQNWAYADVEGNLAYFSSAELPLRKDLEQGFVFGAPPFMVRDGSGPANWVPDAGHSQGQAIPYAVLPFDEMPQTVNPEHGFFVNANNDPAGTTLDNDPLNQKRKGQPNAIYYLNPGYANGLRAGRITRLVRDVIEDGKKVSVEQMRAFQGNTQQLDAELMTPFLLEAFDNGKLPGAPEALAALADDPAIAEAVGRLTGWDFSTPTGIAEGYDASDQDGNRTPAVPRKEAEASVAATIYNVWRAKLIQRVVDQTLSDLGLSGVGSGDSLKATHHLLDQEPFTGVGASGVDFFPEPSALSSAQDRRDATLLAALRTALDALASNDFANAFGHSTDQEDYRWGRLHRITFDHPTQPSLSVPPAGGFDDLSPELPGVARDGGYEVVNASGFSARADRENSFRFGGGPVRRYVGEGGVAGGKAIRGFNVVPGGPSGDAASPHYTTQLGTWLSADQHPVVMNGPSVIRNRISDETFVPGP